MKKAKAKAKAKAEVEEKKFQTNSKHQFSNN